ncbi:MAG: DegT/DnrJ/EryC1/StrS aminotransferase family protein [Hyphomicrobiales bacterium]
MKNRIPYTKPSITRLEQDYAADAVANGWGEKCYDYIIKFEKTFAQYLGVKHAIATSSCTGALHMGLAALSVGRGDEVIIADTTWVAAAAAIVHTGATPVFVDVDASSWCISPDAITSAITSKTKAIVATHLYGNLCDLDAIFEIGRKHKIPVIEDAAEALGSEYHGRKAGSLGVFGTFSFHGTKTMTTGEGGMFVTNDDELADKVATLNNHGRAKGQKKQFWSDVIGFKYKMSNVQAAIGLAQIERIEELVSRKRAIFDAYAKRLLKHNHISMNPEPAGTRNSYWMPTAVFTPESGVTRERLQEAFASEQIDARVFFWPLSGMPMFKPVRSNTNSWDLPGRAINLPSFHDMTEDEIARVAGVIESLGHGG